MNIDEIVAYMIDELKSLPEGTELSSGRLMNKVLPLNVHDLLRFEIDSKFRSVAWENGFYLNSSLYYRIETGLLFNCTFFLKKKKEEKKFDLLRWRMCSDVDSGLIVEINLHKKTVSYFHTPETVDPDIHQCSEDEWRKIADMINDSKFSQWEEKYGNAAEIDDSNWEVELICNGSVVKKSRGFHYFPDEWRIFNILQEQCRSFSDVEYAIPFPDEKMYRFIDTVELDGVLDLPKRWEIFSQISKGKRVKLVREKGSFFKKNIIRVDMPFSDGRKIGSIPENLAALWACYQWRRSKMCIRRYLRIRKDAAKIREISAFHRSGLDGKFGIFSSSLLCGK